MSVLLT